MESGLMEQATYENTAFAVAIEQGCGGRVGHKIVIGECLPHISKVM